VISSFTCGTTFTAQPDGFAMIWMQPVQAAGYPLSEFLLDRRGHPLELIAVKET
jgi:hypothetical protein